VGATMFCNSITPFTADGSLDEPALRLHLRRLVIARNGISLGSGGAGEGHVLTTPEYRRLFEIGVEEARGRVPVLAALRESPSAAAKIKLARDAVAAGVDVIQIYQLAGGHGMVPSQREQECYFGAVLDAIDHPVAICVHAAAGYRTTVPFLQALCSRYGQVCAINVMGGLPNSYFLQLRDALPASVRIYTDVSNLWRIGILGAAGSLLSFNNVIPNICQRIADGYAEGDWAKAAEATRTVIRFAAILSEWSFANARATKMAMKVLGLGNGVLRPPYVLPSESDQQRMAGALASLRIRELEGLTGAPPE
jgi:4-hydroxy-tetrahydrodipicolinate synthase